MLASHDVNSTVSNDRWYDHKDDGDEEPSHLDGRITNRYHWFGNREHRTLI